MAWDLKSEEEVKEYLENLSTEYKFGCFSEQKPEGSALIIYYVWKVIIDFGLLFQYATF